MRLAFALLAAGIAFGAARGESTRKAATIELDGVELLAGPAFAFPKVGLLKKGDSVDVVILSIDNPYGFGDDENRGRWWQANKILPEVVAWLDERQVPRECWWWADETAGTFHPGTCDVRLLDSDEPREVWKAEQ